MSSSSEVRSRDEDAETLERPTKRTKVDGGETEDVAMDTSEDAVKCTDDSIAAVVSSPEHARQEEVTLPPSHSLLGVRPPEYSEDGSIQRIMETDVGISEYVGHDVPKIEGIIKQRYVQM